MTRRLVVFDVDSTLMSVETLDYALAMALGPGAKDKVEAITAKGMSGEIDLSASIMARLDLAPLTRMLVARAANALKPLSTPGMSELAADLRLRGDMVFAVSGGFHDLIGPAMREMGFWPAAVRANRFRWAGDRVSGFDPDNPLSRNGGKAEIVRALKAETGAGAAVMVGDGVTDYEAFAEGAADDFIGFGGVARRAAVEAKAARYAVDVETLAAWLRD